MDKKNQYSYSDNPDVQTPRQYQPNNTVGKQYIFGYSKCIRNTNRAVLDLFSDITVLNEENNTIYPVPIIFGTMEKTIAYVFGEQFANNPENKESGLVDRLILPAMSLQPKDLNFDEKRYVYHESRLNGKQEKTFGQEKKPYDVVYTFSKGLPINYDFTLNIWAKYYEHLMQMVEQVFQKFSPISYIRVEGIPWETPVLLQGSTNNVDGEIDDRQFRILRYAFNIKVEGYIAQPIKRDKTVLKIMQRHVVMGDSIIDSDSTTLVNSVKDNQTPDDIGE